MQQTFIPGNVYCFLNFGVGVGVVEGGVSGVTWQGGNFITGRNTDTPADATSTVSRILFGDTDGGEDSFAGNVTWTPPDHQAHAMTNASVLLEF
eukprot:2989722-Amphidinium_carterae.1